MLDAIAKVVGGILDSSAARSRQQSAENIAAQNMQLQKDFAQMGVRWRVEDAKAAGIHPVAALGMQGPSFSPVQLGDTGSTNWSTALSGLGLDKMGQNTDRAELATSSQSTRDAVVASKLELEGKALDNEFKRLGLASAQQRIAANANPPMPLDAVELKESKLDDATPLVAFGRKLGQDKGWSDGQTFEDRWGDWGGSLAGLGVMGADLYRTGQEMSRQGRFDMTADDRRSLDRSIKDWLWYVDRKTRIY